MKGLLNAAKGIAVWMVVMAVLSTGCSPSQRFVRLVERHPYLVRDSVVSVIDTVLLPGTVEIDTLLCWTSDTVHIETERLSVDFTRLFRDADRRVDSLLAVRAVIKPDTIIVEREVRVPVYRPQITKKRWPWWIIPATLGEIMVIIVFVKLK